MYGCPLNAHIPASATILPLIERDVPRPANTKEFLLDQTTLVCSWE